MGCSEVRDAVNNEMLIASGAHYLCHGLYVYISHQANFYTSLTIQVSHDAKLGYGLVETCC